MHKPWKNPKLFYLLGAIIVVGIALWLGWNYIAGTSTEWPKPENVNSSTPIAASSQSPGPEPSKPSSSPEPVTVLVRGIAKSPERQPISGATVALYRGDHPAAKPQPQATDENGGFAFQDLPIRPGTIYSLQVKSPGLAGEATFTTDNIDSKTKTVYVDVALSPASNTAGIPAKPLETDDRSLKDLRAEAEVARIIASSEGINSSLHTLLWIAGIATLLSLLSLGVAAWRGRSLFVIGGISQQLEAIITEQKNLTGEISKAGNRAEINKTLQEFVTEQKKLTQEINKAANQAEINKTLQELVSNLRLVGEHIRKTDEYLVREKPPRADGETSTESESVTIDNIAPAHSELVFEVSPEPDSFVSYFKQRAIEAYSDIANGRISLLRPEYLKIEPHPASASSLEENKVCFSEVQLQGPFLLFREGLEERGWVFPDPSRNYAEDVRQVFSQLSRENFSQKKFDVAPIEVRLRDGSFWQVV